MYKSRNLSKCDFPFPYPCLLLSVTKTIRVMKDGARRAGHVLLFTLTCHPDFCQAFVLFFFMVLFKFLYWSSWPPTFTLFKTFFYFCVIFKGYFPFTVIRKHWLYSLCCTTQYILEPVLYQVVCASQFPAPPSPLPRSPLVTTSLFSVSQALV